MVILRSRESPAQDIFPERKGQKHFKGWREGHLIALVPSHPGGKTNPEGSKEVRNMKGWLWGLRGTLAYNLVKKGSH